MNSLKLFTIGALAAASLESQAAVIHTALNSNFDASVTVETVADGSLKFTVDFNSAPDDRWWWINTRLAYIQFPTIAEGKLINTSDPDEIFVQKVYAGEVTGAWGGRGYYNIGHYIDDTLVDQHFSPGETDVFFIEPLPFQHFDADSLFAQPVRLWFQHEDLGGPYWTREIEVATVVSPAVPEPSTALLGLLGLAGLARRKR